MNRRPPETASNASILQVCAVDFTARHFLMPLLRAQRQAGFEVHLACSPGRYVAEITAEGFPFIPLPFRRSYDLLAHWRAYRELRSLMRRRRFTVVHVHTPVAAMITRPAARRAGTPLILYTAHGFYFHDDMRPAVRRFHIALERWAQRYADFLFTQSEEDLRTAVEERIAPADRAMAIGNGVNVERFRPGAWGERELEEKRRELGIRPGDGPLVAVIGRLVREKGYLEFLRAFAAAKRSFPRARALVIGEALSSDREDSAGTIRRESAALGLEQAVVFAGQRSDVPALLALADVFCLPSWREGMPRSLIEAMATGLPVVATDIRGCREEVVEGETGLLTPVRDAEALGQALARLMGDEALRRRMGEAGRRRAVERYDEALVIGRQMERMRGLFEEKGLVWPESPRGR